MTTTAAPARHVVYPTRDGKPMAETDKHAQLMMYARSALQVYFADQPNVYVSGNNFVFWEEGNPKARISPDAYVVFGSEMRLRDSYKSWEEDGRLPNVIFEFTSRKTQQEDTDTKLPLYEHTLRTPEYFLFDPTGDYLKPRLQGYRLQAGHYIRLELIEDRLHSEQLGLDLVQVGETMRLYDPVRQEFLPTVLEQAQQIAMAQAEIQRLRAEIAALQQRDQ